MANYNQPVIFMHIPKTAGSTLQQLINHNCSSDKIFTLGVSGVGSVKSFKEKREKSVKYLYNCPQAERDSLEALVGHFSYGLHTLFCEHAKYITLIRNPIQRIVSHYNFVKNNPQHYLYQKLMRSGGTLFDYIEKVKSLELNNGMTRMFYGSEHVKIPFGNCREEMLDIAFGRIEDKFLAIGVQEYFDDSLKLFSSALNWEIPPIKDNNVGNSKSSSHLIDCETIEKIIHYNYLDIILYERIKAGFLNRLESADKG